MPPVLPRVIVNCKVYPEALGTRAVALAKKALEIERETGVAIALCVQAVDVRACAATGARVYAQHFDRVEDAQATGATSWDGLRDAGVQGTLLNHSEKRLPVGDVSWHVEQVRAAKLVSVLCARTSEESGRLAALRPGLIAIEPPELIGGNVSVTTADPGIVERSVRAVQATGSNLPVLCGAGVKSVDDVRRARELGAHGILVASGITRAKEPAKALRDLVEGLRG